MTLCAGEVGGIGKTGWGRGRRGSFSVRIRNERDLRGTTVYHVSVTDPIFFSTLRYTRIPSRSHAHWCEQARARLNQEHLEAGYWLCQRDSSRSTRSSTFARASPFASPCTPEESSFEPEPIYSA